MTQPNFDQILKQVSRSFYLSMSVLPEKMRQPVAMAYLLARAADSFTDSDDIEIALRTTYLDNLLEDLSDNLLSQHSSNMTSIPAFISDEGEKKLIEKLPDIIRHFHKLADEDKNQIRDVVSTLVSGMKMDLSAFEIESENDKKITALKDQQSLDKYIYLVAGCVGEFWTKSAMRHLPATAHWDITKQTQLGIEFGKALQLTNILRDIAKDAKMGRCYLPYDALKLNKLNTEMLLDKQNDALFRPIIFKQLSLAITYFKSAESYLFNTPRTATRLRLGSIWPILIGLKTLELIASKENFLDPEKNIKVQRKWVYSMLIRSLLIVHSNTLLKLWINQIKQNIQLQLNQHTQ